MLFRSNSKESKYFLLKEALKKLDEIIDGEMDSLSHADFGLTKRELEVSHYLVKGFTNREIASAFGLSSKTIEFHLKSIYAKLDCSNRGEAIAFIVEKQVLRKP